MTYFEVVNCKNSEKIDLEKQRVTVAYGDGIGPEIMTAVIKILKAADVPVEFDIIEIGESLYKRGILSGIPNDAWDTIRKNKILLKAPITTPQGSGYKSINVTLRKSLGLFANVRDCKSYTPFVASPHPGMNLIIIRENEEDLYAGIEHRQTQEVTQVLKILSKPGTENIIRYAFEYTKAYGRKKLTCMTKDNIMKITDGMFHKMFTQIATEYPEIKSDHQIIDIGAARVAAQPESLDVIVTLNLYGDIISDIAAQVAGSVGLAGSANIGKEAAMFEAIHGSAPDIAGRGIANPSGLLVAAIQMLVHIGLPVYAEKIANAWLSTIEDGIHTADIYREGLSEQEVGTDKFTDAIIERFGKEPSILRPVHYKGAGIHFERSITTQEKKELKGVDIFLDWDKNERNPLILGKGLESFTDGELKLKLITNRGVKVYPDGFPETFSTDHWRCRFLDPDEKTVDYSAVLSLMNALSGAGYDIIKTENLYTFDGIKGYSLGQGE